MHESAGGKYNGSWSAGKRHGQGTSHYPDGAIHVGEYANDQRHGHGNFSMRLGSDHTMSWWYSGAWADNVPHGHGEVRAAAAAIVQPQLCRAAHVVNPIRGTGIAAGDGRRARGASAGGVPRAGSAWRLRVGCAQFPTKSCANAQVHFLSREVLVEHAAQITGSTQPAVPASDAGWRRDDDGRPDQGAIVEGSPIHAHDPEAQTFAPVDPVLGEGAVSGEGMMGKLEWALMGVANPSTGDWYAGQMCVLSLPTID